MTNAETSDKAATVAEQGAHVASEKAPAKRDATKTKGAPKAKKSAKAAEPKKAGKARRAGTQKRATEARSNKKAEVTAMMKRAKGATLAGAHGAWVREHPGQQRWREGRILEDRRREAQLPHREAATARSRCFQRSFRFQPGRRCCVLWRAPRSSVWLNGVGRFTRKWKASGRRQLALVWCC